MASKHKKLSAIKQSKVCKFMPKMHQNMFGGRAPHDPLEELLCSPRSISAMGGPLLRGTGGKRDGKGGEGNCPQIQGE